MFVEASLSNLRTFLGYVLRDTPLATTGSDTNVLEYLALLELSETKKPVYSCWPELWTSCHSVFFSLLYIFVVVVFQPIF